jgi:hypothetical protein
MKSPESLYLLPAEMNPKLRRATGLLHLPFFFLLFGTACYISLHDPVYEGLWTKFPDCRYYLYQSTIPLASENFWFPTFSPALIPKPFTIPLLYKIAGSDPDRIIQMQKILHFFSGFLLSSVISIFVRKIALRFILGTAIVIIFCWWNILGWTGLLLSESLSFSFLFIWFSTFLLYCRFNNRTWLFIHMVAAVLLSFTRDSWPVVLILFYTLSSLVFYFFRHPKMSGSLVLFLLSIVMFNVQQVAVQKGERHRIPILNNIAVRILENTDYLDYFTARGMPQSDSLRKELGGINLRDPNNRGYIYHLYFNNKYAPLNRWIVENGRHTYMSFLISHPAYFFMLHEPPASTGLFFKRNLYGYTEVPLGISRVVDDLFPVVSYLALLIFTVVLVIINLVKKNIIHLQYIVFYMMLVANAVFIYNADSVEVERHLFFNSVFVEILGVITICFIFDNLECLKPRALKSIFKRGAGALHSGN